MLDLKSIKSYQLFKKKKKLVKLIYDNNYDYNINSQNKK